jgi:hypothetical protein
VTTLPTAVTLREKALKLLSEYKAGDNSYAMTISTEEDFLPLQRQVRAELVDQYIALNRQAARQRQQQLTNNRASLPNSIGLTIHPLAPYGPGGYTTELLSRKTNVRNKKNFRRDNRIFEREERRKRNEIEGRLMLRLLLC